MSLHGIPLELALLQQLPVKHIGAWHCIVNIICTNCHAGKPLAVNPIITYRFYIWNNNLISYKAVQYDVGVKHKELVAILQKKYDVVDILKYA